jgi:glutathione synthase
VARILDFAAQAPGKVVLKPWDGNGGRGVLVSRHGDPNLRSMAEILTGEGRAYVIAQHYIPEIKQGDKRIILIDGEPVGQMLRVPHPGDHRGNMHVGATVEACELTERDREVCDALGPLLREMGLLFVGIDMIGNCLTEVNVTSPTGIWEINALMGVSLERTLTDAVVARHAQRMQETAR